MNTVSAISLILLVSVSAWGQTARLSLYSDPAGAEAFLDSSFIGTTPVMNADIAPGSYLVRLFWPSVRKWNAVVRAESLRVIPGEEIEKTFEFGTALLVPLKPEGRGERMDLEIEFGRSDDPEVQRWATYTAAGAMIVSGVIAAYTKHQANSHFDRYLLSKNPADLAATERNDLRSTIALMATQASFALLTYLLLSD